MAGEPPIRLGVSACLLGERVRHNGGHKRDAYLVERLGEFVEWVSVCPEVAIELDVPREPIQLERVGGGMILLLGADSRTNHTQQMREWADRQLAKLEETSITGYILKSRSPSCGLEGVAVMGEDGVSSPVGRGVFAAALTERFPYLPVEEESGLEDRGRRDRFLEHVFAHSRLRSLFAGRWSRSATAVFHTRHELQLRAHSPKHQAELGRLVASIADLGRQEFRGAYEALFMEALRTPVNRDGHVDVLEHVLSRLLAYMDAESSRQLQARIDEFRDGSSVLAGPLKLIQRYVRSVGGPYLQEQSYIEPDPREWALRY